MTKSAVGDWSQTAASNTSCDGNNTDEGCAMSGMNNAIRGVMAATRGVLTATTLSLTDSYVGAMVPTPDAYATNVAFLANFQTANQKNSSTANFNALGVKNIVRGDGTTLNVSDLLGYHILAYDGTSLRVLNPRAISTIADATNGGISVSISAGLASINLAPADLATKATPTTSDSVVIQDAADSNKAKTATLASLPGGTGASLVLIATATASNSTAINFTSGINSTYDEYELHFNSVLPATSGANLRLHVSTDGGSTWKSGSTDYGWSQAGMAANGSAIGFAGSGTGDTAIGITSAGLSSTSHFVGSGKIRFSSPAGSDYCVFFWQTAFFDSSGIINNVTGSGVYGATPGAINAIQLQMSTGNISGGKFYLYGVKKS